jgi:hypothetical protein
VQKWVGICIVFFLLTGVPANVLGYEKTLFQDSFSDLTHWEQVFNEQGAQPGVPCRGASSPKMAWQAVNGRAMLHIDHSSPCKVVIQPQGIDLSHENVVGIEFDTWFDQVDVDRNWVIHWQDKNNYLGFHLFNNVIYPEKYVDGRAYSLSPEYIRFTFLPHTRYQIKLKHDFLAQTISLIINNTVLQTFQENSDSPRNTGLPGLAGSVGAARNFSYSEYDSVRIFSETAELPSTLDVPLIKQTDPRWSDLEYDRASIWSPQDTSIGRWGCALTSAVMVFRFFGLHNFPDGSSLSPASLNTWLMSQPDGFIEDGLLNWRVLSRLSHNIAETWETPTLEMNYLSKGSLWKEQLWQLLSENIPPILALPGHFVVAHGFQDDATLLVRDPGFSVSSRSIDEMISARVFTPSHTDLSALTLFVPSQVQVDNVEGWTRILESTLDGQHLFQVFDLAKPTDNAYEIMVSNPDVSRHTFKLLAYDQSGNVQMRTETLPAQTNSLSFILTREIGETWHFGTPPATWQALTLGELTQLLHRGHIQSPWIIVHFRQHQDELKNKLELPLAEAKMKDFENTYNHLQEKKWATALAIEQLILNHRQQLRFLFP